MAGEQILLPFPLETETEEDPVSPERYVQIVRAKTVPEVCAAFRGRRLPARREEMPEPIRKQA